MKRTLTILTMIIAFATLSFAQTPTLDSVCKFKNPLSAHLDTITQKTIYTYTEKGQTLERIIFTWNSDSMSLMESSKTNYIYVDDYNSDISVFSYKWNLDSNDWINNSKIEKTYDANENQIKAITYTWNTDENDWIKLRKQEYTYDANNNQTQHSYYTWDTDENDWVNATKYKYTYDANNNKTSYTYTKWNTSENDWKNITRHEYTYDDDNLTSYIYFSWNSSDNDWENRYKYDYTYDDDNLTSYIYFSWNSSDNDWVNKSKYDYTYDENNNLILKIIYIWNSSDNDWVNKSKYEYTYGVNNNQSSYTYIEWNSSDNDWVNKTKSDYTYNLNYLSSEVIGGSKSNPNVKTIWKTSKWSDNTWQEDFIYAFYYSNLTAGIDALMKNNTKIYPNPAKDFVIIQNANIQNVKILDITGKIVFLPSFQEGAGQETIDVSSLQTGVYFIRINQNETLKFIKE